MRSQAVHHSVSAMSRLLQVSRSGFYAWAKRPPSARSIEDLEMARRIQGVHAQSRGTYGAARVHAELRPNGKYSSSSKGSTTRIDAIRLWATLARLSLSTGIWALPRPKAPACLPKRGNSTWRPYRFRWPERVTGK